MRLIGRNGASGPILPIFISPLHSSLQGTCCSEQRDVLELSTLIALCEKLSGALVGVTYLEFGSRI